MLFDVIYPTCQRVNVVVYLTDFRAVKLTLFGDVLDVGVVVGNQLVSVEEQLVGLLRCPNDPVHIITENRRMVAVMVNDLILNAADPIRHFVVGFAGFTLAATGRDNRCDDRSADDEDQPK